MSALTDYLEKNVKKAVKKVAPEEPVRDPFNEHIRVHGFPRFLSYPGERRDN